MSGPKPPLSLTKRAQRDARAIQVYTLGTWGPEQAAVYETAIHDAMETLREHPKIGTARDEIRPGLLSFPVERHVLFYRHSRGGIEILRILHERADAAGQLRARRSNPSGQ